MKNYFDSLKYLIFALVVFLAGMISENPFIADSQEIDVKKIKNFEQVLHRKETEIEQILALISDSLKYDKFQTVNDLIFINLNFDELTKKGLSVLVFKKDTLVFWTDNSLKINSLYQNNNFDEYVQRFPNGWFEIRKKQVGYYKIVGLIKIKSLYPFKNKYLQDNFQKDFGLPPNVKVSNFIVSNSFKIKNKEGEIILCLIPHGSVISYSYNFASFLYLIAIILFSVFIYKFSLTLFKNGKKLQGSLFLIFIFVIRWLSIKYQIPSNLYSLNIFSSEFYATPFLLHSFRSLGDFFVNILLIYTAFALIIQSIKPTKNKFSANFNFFATYLSFALMFFFNNFLILSLVLDSSIPLEINNLVRFNFLSFVAIATIIIISFLWVFVFYEFVKNFKNQPVLKHLAGLIAASVLYMLLSLIFKELKLYYALYFLVLGGTIILYLKFKKISSLYVYLIFINLISLYIADLLITANIMKKEEDAKVLINQLISERDNVAELLFKDIVPLFDDDNNIIKYLKKYNPHKAAEKITQYLENRYFKGYWKKYNISVDICCDNDTMQTVFLCQSQYGALFQNYGTPIDTASDVYFIKNNEGKKFYLIKKYYKLGETDFCNVYIKLDPKLYPQNIGYPELLLDESIQINKFPEGYSYAEYINDELVLKRGEFNYPLSGAVQFKKQKDYKFYVKNGWKHLVLHNKNIYYVLSYKQLALFDKIVTFSYVFIFFNLIFLLYFGFASYKKIFDLKNINFRTKLIFVIFSLLLISFLFVGVVTFNFNLNQFKARHLNDIQEKLNSISVDLKFTYENRDSMPSFWSLKHPSALTYKVHKLSEVFNNDINIYNTQGNLIATSRPEIFTKDITGNKINPQALKNILLLKQSKFIHNEQIGNLRFLSAYAPLTNRKNKIIAIINIPYFANSDQFHKQQTNLLATLVNIYVVLFVFSIILGVFLAEQIVSPLNLLAEKFEKLEIGKYEKIDYQRQDEIGELVKAYNEMVDKLDENIKLLAKSERESAWRDMARQIAHEIKNPLTPMQLSIQMLLRAWENKDPDFDSRLRETGKTLIEQIEVLRRIAEQFGEFAKIPQPKEVLINLPKKIRSIVNLFKNSENTEIITNIPDEEIIIKADEEFINRIFVNLIKNSLQAIPNDRQGKIEIGIKPGDKKVIVYVKDNGVGISDEIKDKLFTPHFTTKSSGMGIGLNMVKNLVEAMNGKVWFESNKDEEGVTFFVEFPIYV